MARYNMLWGATVMDTDSEAHDRKGLHPDRRRYIGLAPWVVGLVFVAVEIRRVAGQVAVRYPDFFPAAEWASRFDLRRLGEWQWADGLYPMGYRLLLRLGVELGLDVLSTAFVLSIFGGFIGLLGTFLLVRRLTGNWALALLTETVLASTSYYLFFGSLDSTDMLAAGLQILSVATLFADGRPRRPAFVAGFLAGLSYLIRYTASLTVLLCALYLVVSAWCRRTRSVAGSDADRWWMLPMLYLFGAAVGAAPQLIASTLVKGDPFYSIQARNLWFHVTGGSDYIFEWQAAPEDLSVWDVAMAYPRELVTHWAGQVRGFWVTRDAVVLDAPFAPLMHAGLLFAILVPGDLSRGKRVFLGIYVIGNVLLLSLIRLDKRFLIVLMPMTVFAAVYFLWRILPSRLRVHDHSVPLRVPVMVLLSIWSLSYPLEFMTGNPKDRRTIEVSNTLHAAGMVSADQVYSTHMRYQDVADPWKPRFPQAASIAPRLGSYGELLDLLRTQNYQFLIYDEDTGRTLYPDLEFLLSPESRPRGLAPVHLGEDREHAIYRVVGSANGAYRATEARWENGIRLKGYETYVSKDVPEREDDYRLGVYLHWEAVEPVTRTFKVFVHLLGSDKQLVAQHDGLPVLWTYNTDAWRMGETVVDFHQMVLDEAPEPDLFTLRVGWYTEDDGRVPLAEPGGGGDSLTLPLLHAADEG